MLTLLCPNDRKVCADAMREERLFFSAHPRTQN